MSRFRYFAPLLCLAMIPGIPGWAQSKTASSTDLNKLIQDLSTPSTHDVSLAELKKLPASTIVPLFDAASDDTRPQKIRDDITAALDAIASRERTAANIQDIRLLAAWTLDTGLNAYEKGGPNPKWDANARRGFDAFDHGLYPAAVDSFTAAIKDGCNDGLVRFERDFCALTTGHGGATAAKADFLLAFRDLEASSYPESRKCGVESSVAILGSQPDLPFEIPKQIAIDALNQGISHLPALVKANPGHRQLRLVAGNLNLADARLRGDGSVATSALIDAISAALPNDSTSFFFKANYYTTWAWQARGNGFAGSVTDQGWQLFHERLEQAHDTAEKGWRLNPLDPDCPTVMIQVCMGEGLDRKEMESWFSRAILADPHNLNAYHTKEQYLLPKWEGSEKEELEFGRYCVAHGDAQDRIPALMIEIYKDLTELAPDNGLVSSPQYWPDIQSAFEKLLADKSRLQTNRAQYLADRAAYVKAACDSQHWREATTLMKEFGKDIDVNAFGGQALYDYYQQKAATAAGEKPSE